MTQPDTHERAPFTFKLILGAAAGYLLLRLIQSLAWLIDWLS